jgi:hypothetical protein
VKITQKKVESLIPYINNSRTHSDEQVAQIAASIKEFGWTNPILVDGDNSIIAGHGRLLAARKLGYKEVPTIELADLTETQKKAYIIADNRLALNAGWDNELLTIELNDLLADGFALELLGFDPKELDALLEPEVVEGLTDEDAVPDVPDEPTTKLGDIYQLGNHRLMCGDSTSIDAVQELLMGQRADMVFTDPPYNVAFNGRSGKFDVIKNDDLPEDQFAEFIKDWLQTFDGFFGGSGSTLIACEKINRHARLMELDPKYCDVIVKRWEDFTGKKAVLLLESTVTA